MSMLWLGVLGTSAAAFGFKYLGHSIPEKYLNHPRALQISTLIPISLLSALVVVQTFTEQTRVYLDHRTTGLMVAFIALLLKAPFPVVVLSAAITSAMIYRLQ